MCQTQVCNLYVLFWLAGQSPGGASNRMRRGADQALDHMPTATCVMCKVCNYYVALVFRSKPWRESQCRRADQALAHMPAATCSNVCAVPMLFWFSGQSMGRESQCSRRGADQAQGSPGVWAQELESFSRGASCHIWCFSVVSSRGGQAIALLLLPGLLQIVAIALVQ